MKVLLKPAYAHKVMTDEELPVITEAQATWAADGSQMGAEGGMAPGMNVWRMDKLQFCISVSMCQWANGSVIHGMHYRTDRLVKTTFLQAISQQ